MLNTSENIIYYNHTVIYWIVVSHYVFYLCYSPHNYKRFLSHLQPIRFVDENQLWVFGFFSFLCSWVVSTFYFSLFWRVWLLYQDFPPVNAKWSLYLLGSCGEVDYIFSPLYSYNTIQYSFAIKTYFEFDLMERCYHQLYTNSQKRCPFQTF